MVSMTARLSSASARLVGFAGATLAAAGAFSWAYEFLYAVFSGTPDWNVGLLPLVVVVQALVAAFVAWGVFVLGAGRLALVSLVAFAVSFLGAFGWYMVLLPMPLALVGVGDLLYLAAAGLAALSSLAARSEGGDNAVSSRPARYPSSTSRALGGFLLAFFATALAYAATPTPTKAEKPSLSDNPPIACLEGVEELGTFRGPGDRTTPTFEVGNPWGYAFSSAGYGDLGVEVLDGNGEAMLGTVERYSGGGLGNGVGGAEFALSGTYKLNIEADENMEYEVLVCDGRIGPAGSSEMKRRPT